MPRFVGKPTIVEAEQFLGSIAFWPESFRRAVVRHLPGGTTEVRTAEGVRPVKQNDWILRGPYGDFSVMKPSAFETFFTEHEAPRARKKELING